MLLRKSILAVSVLLAAQQAAFASNAVEAEQTGLSASEAELAFGEAKPMQTAALSSKEMKETEGAMWANTLGAIAGGISSTYAYIGSTPRYSQTGYGVLGAFAGGAIGGFASPVTGFSSLGRTVFGGLAVGYTTGYISNW